MTISSFSLAEYNSEFAKRIPNANTFYDKFWKKSKRKKAPRDDVAVTGALGAKFTPGSRFKKTVYKPSGLGYKKRPMYKGCMRIEISKGMHLLRKMQFWQQLLVGEFRKNNVL